LQNQTQIWIKDFPSFGSAINEMQYKSDTGGGYRYGFNGKETDSETDLQDYGFRIYNPSIGKFLSVDPLSGSYPWYTPYQFAGNKPINCIDLDGLEELDVKNVKITDYITNDPRNPGKYQYSIYAFNDNQITTIGILYEFKTSKGNTVAVYQATHILATKEVIKTINSPIKIFGITVYTISEKKPVMVEYWEKIEWSKIQSTDPQYTLFSNCYSTAFKLYFGVVNVGYNQLLKDNYHKVKNSKDATIGAIYVPNDNIHMFRVVVDPKTKKETYRHSTPGTGDGEEIYYDWDEFANRLINSDFCGDLVATHYIIENKNNGSTLKISVKEWSNYDEKSWQIKYDTMDKDQINWYAPNE
jgi:RHS repeat-associated protein